MSFGVSASRYNILVPKGEEDPEMGVLVTHRIPSTQEYFMNTVRALINFSEGEAYFPLNTPNLKNAKGYIREVSVDNDLEPPYAYFQVGREEKDPPGVSWEGEFDDLLRQTWSTFMLKSDEPDVRERFRVLDGDNRENNEDLQMDMTTYRAATEI